MFLAISRFAVINGMDDEVRSAFHLRPHHVDSVEGFIRMEVANPTDNNQEFWLLTWWEEERHFKAWHHGHSYRDSHVGIPKGLKLDPGRTKIMHFDVVAE